MSDKDMKLSALDYVYDAMSPADRHAFEEAMRQDAGLETEVNDVSQDLEWIRQYHSEYASLKLSEGTHERIMMFARQEARRLESLKINMAPTAGSFIDRFRFLLQPPLALAFTAVMTAGLVYWGLQEKTLREAPRLNAPAPVTATAPAEIPASESKVMMLSSTAPAVRVKAGPSFSTNPGAALEKRSADTDALGEAAPAQVVAVREPEFQGEEPLVPMRFSRPTAVIIARNHEIMQMRMQQQQQQRIAARSAGAGMASGNLSMVGDSPESRTVRNLFDAAEAAAGQKRWNEALAGYQQVATLGYGTPEGIVAYHQAARIYSQNGNPGKAIELYDIILTRWPDYQNTDKVLLEDGILNQKIDNWPRAQELLQRCHDEFPPMRTEVEPHLQVVRGHVKPLL